MRDKNDTCTLDLLAPLPPVPLEPQRGRGRPPKPDALSDAERARQYRARKKQRLADLRDESKPISSTLIDLSALPAWKRS